MTDRQGQSEYLQDLRAHVERKLGPGAERLESGASDERDVLIHELQVHKAELEMQNDELRAAEAEAERLQRQYQELYDFAPVGYFRMDDLGRIIEANQAAEALLGCGQAVMHRRLFSDFVERNSQDAFYLHRTETLKSRRQCECEFEIVRADGDRRFVEVQSVSHEVRPGPRREIFCALRDITDRREMAAELDKHRRHLEDMVEERTAELDTALAEARRQRDKVEAMLHASRMVLRAGTFEQGVEAIFEQCKQVTGAAAGYVAMLGEDGEANETLFLDSGEPECNVDPDSPMPIRGLRAQACESGRVVYENAFDSSEFQKLMPEGYVALRNVMFAPMVVEGRTAGLLGLANKEGDFTDEDAAAALGFAELAAIALYKARTTERLARSEKKYRMILETATDGLCLVDGRGRFTEVNNACCEMLGYSREELLGMSVADVSVAASPHEVHEHIEETARGGGDSFERQLRRKDGRIIDTHISCTVLEAEDITFVAFIHDLTEQKDAERGIAAAKENLEKAQAISHVGSWHWDFADGRVGASDELFRIAGRNRADVSESPDIETALGLIHEDDVAEVKRFLERLSRKQRDGLEPIEFRIVRPDGEVRYVACDADAVCDEQGRVTGLVGTVQDITDRKEIEETLAWESQVNASLARLANALIDPAVTIDDIAAAVVTEAKHLTDSESGYVCTMSPETGELVCLSPQGDGRSHVVWQCAPGCRAGSLWDRAFIERRPFYSNSVRTGDVDGGPGGVRNFMSAPAMIGYEALGQIVVANGREDYTDRNLDALSRVATLYALAMQREDRREQLIHHRDHLEDLVSERAAELLEANVRLEAEAAGHKRTAEALAEREHQLDLFFSQSIDGFFFMMLDEPVQWDETVDKEAVLDYVFKHQRITKANDAMVRQYRGKREQLLGMTPEGFFKNDPAAGRSAWRELFDAGRLHTETREQRFDASKMWVEGDYICLYDEQGRITGHIGVQRDITERKDAERELMEYQEQLKSLASQLTLAEERERRRLAGYLHDEICQLLVISKIKLESLRSTSCDPRCKKTSGEVAEEMSAVIEASRSLMSELSYPILKELGFEKAVEAWLKDRVGRGGGMKTKFQSDRQPKPMTGDIQTLLFRSVRELLINAVKHSEAEKVSVSIRRFGGEIEVAVADDGVGFDPDEVLSGSSDRYRLGLFSVRERLEQLGGRIEIESAHGQGCRATMRAPLNDNESF